MESIKLDESTLFFGKVGVFTNVNIPRGATILEFPLSGLADHPLWNKYASFIQDGHITRDNTYFMTTSDGLKLVASRDIRAGEELFVNWRAISEPTAPKFTFPIDAAKITTYPSAFLKAFGYERLHYRNEAVFASKWSKVYRSVTGGSKKLDKKYLDSFGKAICSEFYGGSFLKTFEVEFVVKPCAPKRKKDDTVAQVDSILSQGGCWYHRGGLF